MEQEKTDKGEELLESIVEKVVNTALENFSNKTSNDRIAPYKPDENLLCTNLGLELFRALNVNFTPEKSEDYPRYMAARARIQALAKELL